MASKPVLLTLIILIKSSILFSQVSGISASKVGTYCAGTVPAKDLEFEPSFGIFRSATHWDSDRKLRNSFSSRDSFNVMSEFVVRCTYGFSDVFEVGMTVNSDVSAASWGLKYNFLQTKHTGLSFILGMNFPLGNRTYSKKSLVVDERPSVAAGLVMSYIFNDKFLLDVDIQGQTHLMESVDPAYYDFFINSDIGFYASDEIQIIMGSGYYSYFSDNKHFNTFLWDIHPGISYETGQNFLIVISSPIGLYGKNVVQAYGVNIAFTMTIR